MISANFVSLLFYYYCTYTEHLVFFPLMTDRWMFFLLVCPRKNIFFWKQPCLFVTCRLSCFLRLIYRQSTRIYNIKNVLAKIVHSVQSKVSQPAKISRELQKGHYNIEEAFCQSIFTIASFKEGQTKMSKAIPLQYLYQPNIRLQFGYILLNYSLVQKSQANYIDHFYQCPHKYIHIFIRSLKTFCNYVLFLSALLKI